MCTTLNCEFNTIMKILRGFAEEEVMLNYNSLINTLDKANVSYEEYYTITPEGEKVRLDVYYINTELVYGALFTAREKYYIFIKIMNENKDCLIEEIRRENY